MTEMTFLNVQSTTNQKVSKPNLQFSFSADPLMVLHIHVKFTRLSHKKNCYFQCLKTHNSKRTKPDLWFLCSTCHLMLLQRAHVYDWDHYLQCPKGNNSKSRQTRVTVYEFCMLNEGLNLCEVSSKYLQQFPTYTAGTRTW